MDIRYGLPGLCLAPPNGRHRGVPDEKDVLSLVCPQCGAPFSSTLQMDAATFEKIRMDTMLERCTSCGHAAYFSKPDYRFLPSASPG